MWRAFVLWGDRAQRRPHTAAVSSSRRRGGDG
jgi:hypothetical protein